MINTTNPMRLPLFALLLLSLSSCDSTISTNIASDAKRDFGCLRSSLDSCLEQIRSHISVENYRAVIDTISRNDSVDVNGKKVNKENTFTISLNTDAAIEHDMIIMTLQYSERKIITEIRLHIGAMVHYAETDNDYDKLGIYDGVRLAMGTECKELSTSHTFYKFFHNSIKSKVRKTEKLSDLSEVHASTTFYNQTPYVSFCNAKAQYYEMVGDDTNDISSDNPVGTFGHYTFIIK